MPVLSQAICEQAIPDLISKLNAYRRNGIREYLVWQVQDPQVKWFKLEGG
ncbi:MAG: hypothetical protein HC924_11400 [Synechococcaceae cyanobacterium SM2_3_2]|nr:hypothetical protein [Synechococcaceae cyanobacterium SM2_3_2]